MKKTISILLVIAMLLSMVVAAIPAGAESAPAPQAEATAPTTAPTTMPKDVEGLPVKTWDKPWETAPSEWTAVATMAELATAIKKGNNIKVYMTADITIDDNIQGHAIKNVTLDGNGHAFIYNSSSKTIFSWANNVEIRNLILKGTLTGSGNTALAPIGGHNSGGACDKVILTNIWSDVDVNLSAGGRFAGGVIGSVGANSVLTDVIYTGNITSTSSATVNYIGGIAGLVTAPNGGSLATANAPVSFVRCYVTNAKEQTAPTFSFEHKVSDFGGISSNLFNSAVTSFTHVGVKATFNFAKDVNTSGGIYGCSSNQTTVNNAYVDADFNFNGGTVGKAGGVAGGIKGSMTDVAYVGTIYKSEGATSKNTGAFAADGSATYTRCYTQIGNDKAKIDVRLNDTSSSNWYTVGGFAAYPGNSTFNNCYNGTEIVVSNSNDGATAAQAPSLFAAGFVAISHGALTFNNCSNAGSITINANVNKEYFAIGGYTGWTNGTVAFNDCTNAATMNIKMIEYTATADDSGIGGYSGRATPTFKHCSTEGLTMNIDTSPKDKNCVITRVGGFVGKGSATLSKNDNGGNVAGANITTGTHLINAVGGVLGSGTAAISDLTSKNIITINNGATHLGGVVACAQSGTLNNVVSTDKIVHNKGGDGNSNLGGVIGSMAAVSVSNVTYSGSISLTNNSKVVYMGLLTGLVTGLNGKGGYSQLGDGTEYSFTNCHVRAAEGQPAMVITTNGTGAVDRLGGISGFVFSKGSCKGTVENVSVTATIVAPKGANHFGGIFGSLSTSTTLKNVTSNVTLDVDGKSGNVGGIVGDCSSITATNVVNNGNITVDANVNNVGGIIGSASGTSTINFATNNGDITITATDTAGDWSCTGGLAGRTNATITFNGCVNSGDITYTNTNTDFDRYFLFGGMAGVANQTLTFNGCQQLGDLSTEVYTKQGTHGIGGYIGWVNNVMNFNNCVNDASIYHKGTIQKIGGILGYTNNQAHSFDGCINLDSENGTGITVEYTGSGNVHVGGILGYKDGSTLAVLENVVNTAPVSATGAKEVKIGGIVGIGAVRIENAVNSGEITGKKAAAFMGEVYLTLELYNAIDLIGQTLANGAITGSDAKPNFKLNYETANKRVKEAVDEIINGMDIFNIYGYEEFNAALEEAATVLPEKDKYVATVWNKFENAYNAALKYEGIDGNDFDIVVTTEGGVEVDYLSQSDFSKLYADLVNTYESLVRVSEAPAYLEKVVADAETFMAENKAVYFESYWKAFNDAYIAAKAYLVEIKTAVTYDTDVIMGYVAPLENAMNALANDINALGGYISSAEEFARLDGQKGKFYLTANITVKAPLNGFEGYLYGQGHTITLDGCGLMAGVTGETTYSAFDEPKAVIDGLVIKGNAGKAASIFGKAEKNVEVSNITVELDSIGVAAIFDSADENASIEISNIITYADAKYAVLGEVACAASISNVLAMCEADAICGNEDALVANAYLDGVEYFTAGVSPLHKTDAETLGSGIVAYHINDAFGKLLLVQKIGVDALPKLGRALADETNVVIMVNGVYVNKGSAMDTDNIPTVKPVAPAATNYVDLEKAIALAKALDATLYTEESWAALQTILKNAEAALNATEQEVVDQMLSALTLARFNLVKIAVADGDAVDYKALAELIEAAKALKEADYTEETWANLKAMLAVAEAAMKASTQGTVNTAKVSLNAAITGLMKVAPKEDKPADDNKPADPAPVEDEGCGSVIGGAAVVLTAVLALGAGVSFKKKED